MKVINNTWKTVKKFGGNLPIKQRLFRKRKISITIDKLEDIESRNIVQNTQNYSKLFKIKEKK